jgi:hypothetical protein
VRRQFGVEDAQWEKVNADTRLANGVLLAAGCERRRVDGPLGTGLMVRGVITIGQTVPSTAGTQSSFVALHI